MPGCARTRPASTPWPGRNCRRPSRRPARCCIAIQAASLNFPDLLIVQNKYQMKPPLPFVPGSEFAGVVEAVGDGVKHLKPGDAVAAFGGTGGFATHACVNAAVVMPLPPGFAFDDAAAFVLTYGTTHHALLDRAALKAGETLLVLGRGRRRGHGGDPDRQGGRRARDRRRVERREVRAVPRDRRRRDDQLHAAPTCATRSRR